MMEKKPEKIYANFVEHYEGYWIEKYKEDISDVLKDLNSIPIGISREDEIKYINWMKPLIKKWEKKLE